MRKQFQYVHPLDKHFHSHAYEDGDSGGASKNNCGIWTDPVLPIRTSPTITIKLLTLNGEGSGSAPHRSAYSEGTEV